MKDKKKRIIIFHFLPIEGYPPVQNFIDFIGKDKTLQVYCFTTYGKYKYEFSNPSVKIIRFGNSSIKANYRSLNLYLSYVYYNVFGTLRALCVFPYSVFYYESLSAFPPLFIKFCRIKVKLLIHYHEYVSPREYYHGPIFLNILHWLEKRMFDTSIWISQTNKQRLNFFIKDLGIKKTENFEVVPNYPPKAWSCIPVAENRLKSPAILKLVYVGYALDEGTMYSEEIISWALRHKEVQLDFYLIKVPDLEKEFEENLIANNINFYGSIKYANLPDVLKHYNVGLILYKATTLNYKYNVPNKFFEYLACNLSVWFPMEMVSPKSYLTFNTYPEILELDFGNLDTFKWEEVLYNTSLSFKTYHFNYERVYEKIINRLKSD